MNRIIVFSSQPINNQNEENFPLISLEEVKNKGKPVVLVVVKEEEWDDMEKLGKELGVYPIRFAYYWDCTQQSSDEKYVLSNIFISSPQKDIFSGIFSRTLVMV